MSNQITQFRIDIKDDQLEDLKRRLRTTRWQEPECVNDWTQGLPLGYAQEVASYWLEKYDWRRCESRLNQFPQFKTTIDGLGIHFIHVRSPHPDATPLIAHGWPGSIVEFHKVIEPLTNPLRMAAIPPKRSMSSVLPCRVMDFRISLHALDGMCSASRKPGLS